MHDHHVTHAAGCLAQIARIPSLAGGVVTFDPADLGGGRWWHRDDDYPGGLLAVWCPVPAFDNEKELFAACTRAVWLGIEQYALALRDYENWKRERGE